MCWTRCAGRGFLLVAGVWTEPRPICTGGDDRCLSMVAGGERVLLTGVSSLAGRMADVPGTGLSEGVAFLCVPPAGAGTFAGVFGLLWLGLVASGSSVIGVMETVPKPSTVLLLSSSILALALDRSWSAYACPNAGGRPVMKRDLLYLC